MGRRRRTVVALTLARATDNVDAVSMKTALDHAGGRLLDLPEREEKGEKKGKRKKKEREKRGKKGGKVDHS